MKKYTKYLIILVIVVILFFVYKYFDKLNKIYNSGIVDEKTALQEIERLYGRSVAVNVEKIYRLETAHFKSEQYKKTGSAGMLSFSAVYPFGWSGLATFWATHQKYKPLGVGYEYVNNEGQTFKYLKFENFGGFFTLAEFLKNHSNNAGRWNSTDITAQNNYNNAISLIQNEYVI